MEDKKQEVDQMLTITTVTTSTTNTAAKTTTQSVEMKSSEFLEEAKEKIRVGIMQYLETFKGENIDTVNAYNDSLHAIKIDNPYKMDSIKKISFEAAIKEVLKKYEIDE